MVDRAPSRQEPRGGQMIVETTAQAAALELPALLVLEPVGTILDAAGLGEGPVEAVAIGDGHSNVTFLLTRGDEKFVLRRPPRPPLPPSAHDVLREARILRALAGTSVRVPRVLLEHAGDEPLGVPFYVMEFVAGSVITDEVPHELDTEEERRRVAEELVAALVELHEVDPPAGIGAPSGYLERQLRRFSGLWEQSKTREIEALDEVTRRLAARKPASSETTVVHGDYRLGNAIFAPAAPARIAALLDWEMATVGDPLADVGYLTATWVEPGYSPGPLALSPVTALDGFPGRDELTAWYEKASRRRVENLEWFRALALWKGAIFLEGNYRRWLDGRSDDPFYGAMDEGVPLLADLALQELNGT